jgi:hypothetical protein
MPTNRVSERCAPLLPEELSACSSESAASWLTELSAQSKRSSARPVHALKEDGAAAQTHSA